MLPHCPDSLDQPPRQRLECLLQGSWFDGVIVIQIKWALAFISIMLVAVVQADEQTGLSATLDNFHQAAARADTTSYLQATTEDMVFLGTDGTERWQGQGFRDFVESRFATGRGWDYRPVERNVMVTADGQTAWFDETLQNADLGLCRGSGVLVKSADGWKIAQYNLSVPVPNAMILDVVEDIAALDAAAAMVEPETPDVVSGPAEVKETITRQEAPAEPEVCRKKRFKTNFKASC
jgi:ketosteroid isomerase-like protein